METKTINLYDVAEMADEAFQAALVEEHGAMAGDIRYQPKKQSARVKALGKAYQNAIEAWRVSKGFAV